MMGTRFEVQLAATIPHGVATTAADVAAWLDKAEDELRQLGADVSANFGRTTIDKATDAKRPGAVETLDGATLRRGYA